MRINQRVDTPGVDAEADHRRRRRLELATTERVGATVILTITTSELAGYDIAASLREALEHVRREGARRFVLDLQNVALMDSVCIGALVESLTSMQEPSLNAPRAGKRSGGDPVKHPVRMAVVNAQRNVAYLFRLTKLDRVFPICRDVMSALAAVEGREGELIEQDEQEAPDLMRALQRRA
ncbi:MAG: STAS domain-containing protein [Phycisphaerales bacterium]